jgi:tetratricopeptide (TPR) repeat protein
MRVIKKLLASWYTGGAFSRFARKNYKDAADLFEKALRLDPDSGRKELSYSCLGRCYLVLGRMNEALKNLSMAYELYEKNISAALQNDFELSQYKEFLKAYSYALEQIGKSEYAHEIARRAEDVDKKKEMS